MYSDFQYVVERQKPQRICFLSTRERGLDKLAKGGVDLVYNLDRTSAMYHVLNKVRSGRGVGGLANLASRFQNIRLEETPGPTEYDLMDYKIVKKNRIPFGNTAPRLHSTVDNNPGPCTYNGTKQRRRLNMMHSFGGPMQMVPAIELKCVPRQKDVCEVCGKLCQGDYWHQNHSLFVCLGCMKAERYRHKKFKKQQLKEFSRIRTCAFMHDHQGTSAAIRLMTSGAVRTKFAKENYLDLYLSPYT